MAKITKSKRLSDRETITVRTSSRKSPDKVQKWWKASTQEERGAQALASATYLREMGQSRVRQASMFTRMYSNMPLFGAISGGLARGTSALNQLPIDRPTMNVVQSCVDTLVSRITQARPRPIFLTDNGDYKARNLAKQLTEFVAGELYQTQGYRLGELILRDASVLGTGAIKVFEGLDKKVKCERKLSTELYVDPNDAMWGDPTQLYELKLIDREVLAEMFSSKPSITSTAENAYPDNNAEANKTIADQVIVVEAWHLSSGPDASDGKHIITCSSGVLFEEDWDKSKFPFVFLHYSPRILGFFGQSLAEQLMGTQMEINKLLMTISASINLVGVPRVFVEDGSKVVKAHLNNQIGSIITYRGTKPEYAVAPCVPQEIYAQLQRLIEYAYQQSGVSALSAASQKPAGLNAAVALREYDDLQSDRFASLVKRYDNMFVDLAYLIIDKAKDIAERDGAYQTVYPNKNGTKEIDLPKAGLLKDPFVIQCFDASALPRDPAGRMQKITELIQAGMIDIREGRRLLDYPDLQQNEKLENASEERILQTLDKIVEHGKYTPPDPIMSLELAKKLSIQYYNLYVPAKLEPERAAMLEQFNAQVLLLEQQMQSPQQPAQGPVPQAVPTPLPQSPLLPQIGIAR
jgi:hypothetical protein